MAPMTAFPDTTAPTLNSPHLSDRARGWLQFLWRKATTDDDWSETGAPHPWWDQYSNPPMLDFPRFDLSESSYALGVMADQTPAWREAYATILEKMVERHLTYWAAIDWITHIGPDPRRKDYPKEWVDAYIPQHLVGEYDTPGWCANGVEPWGLQPDPIGAEGNLFFKGWLNLTMSLHRYVSGEDRWSRPFEVAGVDGARFEWTQETMTERLTELWAKHPLGLHCENTKVWPFCLSAAGLGLQLYDAVSGKQTHAVYDAWFDHVKDKFFGFDKKGDLAWTTLYYDPQIEHNHTLGPGGGLGTCLYMMAQNPAFAEKLYHGAVGKLRWNDPKADLLTLPDPRMMVMGLTLAKEYGDEKTFRRLSDHAEANFEPRRFGPSNDEFGWWFNLGEDWPRGQLSALMIMAEVGGPGAWSNLFRQPNLTKFNLPSVEGVAFPALGIDRAWNDGQGVLHVGTYAGDSRRQGDPTSFDVTNLPDARLVAVRCDGADYHHWSPVSDVAIEIQTEIADRQFEIITGLPVLEADPRKDIRAEQGDAGRAAPAARNAAPSAGTTGKAGPPSSAGTITGGGMGCPCC